MDVLRCCAVHRSVPGAGAQLYLRPPEFLSAPFVFVQLMLVMLWRRAQGSGTWFDKEQTA